MAENAMDVRLWEAVRDGNLKQASYAIEQGADPNRSYTLSVDSYGRRTWDFSVDGSLPWRHVLITSDNKSCVWQPPTRGVPTVAVHASSGDTLLHIAVKLQWHELALLLSSMINLDLYIKNDESKTPQEVAHELGDSRVKFYDRYFPGDNRAIDRAPSNTVHESRMQCGRNEFKKSAMRSLEREKMCKPSEFSNPGAPTRLAGYVEQELLQLEMSPAGNDETVIPRFPRYVHHSSLQLPPISFMTYASNFIEASVCLWSCLLGLGELPL